MSHHAHILAPAAARATPKLMSHYEVTSKQSISLSHQCESASFISVAECFVARNVIENSINA